MVCAMPRFLHKRTGKTITVPKADVPLYTNKRHTRLDEPTNTVPDGTIDEVLDWVGDDEQRAEEALQAELAGKRRKTLVDRLT